jgi:putative peptidoglycan lipid II flippase
VLAYRLLRRKVGRFEGAGLASAATRMLVAAGLAGASGFAALWFTGGFAPGSFALATVLGAVATCAWVGLLMLAVYVVALKLLKVDEVNVALTATRRIFAGITRR